MNTKTNRMLMFISFCVFFLINANVLIKSQQNVLSSQKIESESKYYSKINDRDKYFFRLLRDPATNQIPKNIRQKELKFAKILSEKNKLKKISAAISLDWKEAGPNDVGGRTRALAVDITDPNTVITGGISGGIWKSTDKGQSWRFKNNSRQLLSVTSVAQDPRNGYTNLWYYCTGEYIGNSASDQGFRAYFSGDGLFKSTDNGETWNQLQSTASPDPTKWDGNFDYCLKVIVNQTGSVFVAANAIGIFRSTDGGSSFSLVLGGKNQHTFSDITAAGDGTLIAIISSPFQGINAKDVPGIYKSTNDGTDWINITPNSFPLDHMRSVLGLAPSNPSILYILTHAGDLQNGREDIRFFKLNLSDGTSEDRSNNLPDFSADGGVATNAGFYTSQGDYDMAIAVKPDDENFVLIAGTSLFRSNDAFATKLIDKKNGWIGGYNEVTFTYPNFHPDTHVLAFDISNPNSIWCGNDGGLTFTNDITNNSFQDYFPWIDMNNGYNVTQFYQCALANKADDNRLVGGTQDNGTPFFTFDGNTASKSVDISYGDGAYAYLGKNFAYSSSEGGTVTRIDYNNVGNPDFNQGWTTIYPIYARGQLFITPYAIDPADENIMYYPAGNTLWRNNQLESIPEFEQSGTYIGWTQLNLNTTQGYLISTLSISTQPAHILYYALSSDQDAPKIFRLDNAGTQNSQGKEISIPGAAQGAYIHNIAINPDDANEIIVVMSNYNIVGLYHSTNGGLSYTPIEGNLEGDQQNPGPSLRAATILPSPAGNLYLIATSIGVFSTVLLNGDMTNWIQEGTNELGNVVVNYITSRKADGKFAAATHGRGLWIAYSGNTITDPVASVNIQRLHIESKPGLFGTNQFSLSNTGGGNLDYSITTSIRSSKNNLNKIAFINVLPYPVPSGFKIGNINDSAIASSLTQKKLLTQIRKTSAPDFYSTDELIIDDGNQSADDFFGYGDGSNFAWVNEFDLENQDFLLESFTFFMRTESATSNVVYLLILDENFNELAAGYFSFNLSPDGEWFTVNLNSPINFSAGKTFYIYVESYFNGIYFPAGTDFNGQVTGKGYYVDFLNGIFININMTNGFTNGALLIRAIGTLAGDSTSQPPTAVAQVSKTNAQIGELITFDASSSYDNYGQITKYSWDFGDQTYSSQKIDNHFYSDANTFPYSLTITNDKGVTGQTNGQIIITGSNGSLLTTNPTSGSLIPNDSQQITVKFDATSLSEGNYQGLVIIASNGGNITIPVDILVSNNAVLVEEQNEIPDYFSLEQNYPNPFNPTTKIRYTIPFVRTSLMKFVQLKIYNVLGKEVATLVNEIQPAGNYEVEFDASMLTSGIYFCRLKTGAFISIKKMLLIK